MKRSQIHYKDAKRQGAGDANAHTRQRPARPSGTTQARAAGGVDAGGGNAPDRETPLVAIAAGGTGGHVFPALAVKEALERAGARTMILTDSRGAALMRGHKARVLRAGTPLAPGLLAKCAATARLGAGFLGAVAAMLPERPDVMIGFGGYPSFAPMLAARMMNIPALLHEQNAHLGRANRVMAGWNGHLALSWKGTGGVPDDVKPLVCGMPVRAAFFEAGDMKAPARGVFRLLVVGGSLGAEIFAQIVPDALARLPMQFRRRIQVTQQCRREQAQRLANRYRKSDIEADIAGFFENMPELLAASHLVIGRAGASAVAELAASGRPSILVPFPGAMDDHQSANAGRLKAVGAALVAPEGELDAPGLAARVTALMDNPGNLAKRGLAARGLAARDAANSIAEHALRISGARQDAEGGWEVSI